ncbi:multidrug resistance-associated protein 1 isoform X1 [Tetranychus urticae]|uniref:multidrug resistance-associated protein 1 isoform X1 n=1 Tax=Tetranychus urticae TaxID=32264 RepID=UPI00077BC37B|nr:multidrug resistance-associated protein 1 isoform X1 [Tetranychus urticae]
MVLTGYCGYNSSDLIEQWNSDSFVISPCFCDTFLLWIISLFIYLSIPFSVSSLKSTDSCKKLPWTLLVISKLIIGSILIISSIYELIDSLIEIKNDQVVYPTAYVTPSIKLSTYILALWLIWYYRLKGVHTPVSLTIYWFLMTIYSVFNFYSLIVTLNHHDEFIWSFDKTDIINKSLQTSGILCQLFLCCFPDTKREIFTKEIENECPYESSSFIGRLFFSWFDSMAIRGYRKTLQESDIWNLSEENTSLAIERKITAVEAKFNQDGQKKNQVNILKILLKSFWPTLLLGAVCKLFSSLLVFASPQLLDALLSFAVSDQPVWKGYIIAIAMFVSSLTQSIFDSQSEFWTQTTSIRLRSALVAKIYKKTFKLSNLGRRGYSTGEMVNILSVDAQRVMDYVNIVNILWSAPFQLGITIYLLWRQLGVSSIIGLSVIPLLTPFNYFFSTRYRLCQHTLMKEKDSRAKLISEVLSGMKFLKLYAWEGAFGDIIAAIRRNEIKYLKSQAIWMEGISIAFTSIPFLFTVVSFTTYILIDKNHILDANKAFVSISLVYLVNMPLGMLPIVVTYGASFMVSLKRINKFLAEDELDFESIRHDSDSSTPIKVKNATFSWSPDEEPTLKDINLEVEKKKLVAVVGIVGSGKSSLLSALLGDLHKQHGFVNVYGELAYVPQSSWIQNATVRDNILFNEPFLEDEYDQIIEACALTPDLKILAGGDLTEIGEKGINVSGGQKQRISIARAVYSNSDIYLFDDPLSAVDAHVAKHLFDQVIGPKGMLKNKTRLLVTHRITFLPQVDEIVVLRDGKIYESGTYSELMAKKGEFFDYIVQYLTEREEELDPEEKDFVKALDPEIEKKLSLTRSVSTSGSLTSSIRRRKSRSSLIRSSSVVSKKEEPDSKDDKSKLTVAENTEIGSVNSKIYFDYFMVIGVKACAATLILIAALHLVGVGSNLWLTAWSEDSLDRFNSNNTALRNKRLIAYAFLGTGQTILTFVSRMVLSISVINGACWIHEKMLSRLIRAPMSFFDSTPTGRILNRFSADIDAADTSIGFTLNTLVYQLFSSIAAIIVISMETPLLLIVLLVLGVVYIFIQKVYIASSRQLKRIDGVTRSPVYSHLSESVTGSSSIRAYQATDRFTHKIFKLVDVNNSTSIANLAASHWLAIRLQFLGNIIVTSTVIFAINARGSLSPGKTAFTLSYASQITGILSTLVHAFSNIENNLVSVERCLEYTKLPVEASWINPTHRPQKDWPSKGNITFNKYSTRYRPGLDLVLKEITCCINSNEKVGIVGRTGAGKSSLTLALFRLIEPIEGTIKIDDEDITQLGLHDLRSRLTVIPQDPVLFSGSFRRNFDPFEKYADHEIYNAIEQANLKDFVASLDNGLDHEVTEGGDNLSVGQRQLVCLARALLRKSKILVLDEATAAVDVETDELIQQTIREQFKDCTIVTIAHRLNTILDYDKIIVMDKGQIIEHDSPENLLKNDKSVFYSMAKDAKLV